MGKVKIKTDIIDLSKEEIAPVKEEKKVEAKAEQKKDHKKVVSKKIRSEKYKAQLEKVEKAKFYPVSEAVALAQSTSYSKFKGTLEAHINTRIPNIRGLVNLPFLTGKNLVVLAFGKDADKSGADLVGDDEALNNITAGKINFDVLVVTPEWMPKLAKVAKILGPRGLMPNPKSGTITDNLEKTVAELKNGKIEYKTEAKAQVIHLAVGKTDQDGAEITANLKALYNTIGRSRIAKLTLSSTMGPGVKVSISSLA